MNAGACSGLTLSGAFLTSMKGERSTELTPKSWRRRMGQPFSPKLSLRESHTTFLFLTRNLSAFTQTFFYVMEDNEITHFLNDPHLWENRFGQNGNGFCFSVF